MLRVLFLVAALQAPARSVVITIDDLPTVSTRSDAITQRAITTGILTALERGGARAIGFVNEGKLYRQGTLDTARVALLQQWLDAGMELGNHSYSHRSLFDTPVADFERDVLRGETVTRRLLAARNQRPVYFRHPFLNTGPDTITRRRFETFLRQHGYRVAPVTIDNYDYIFARAYDLALDRRDNSQVQRISTAYLAYMDTVVGFYERQSRTLLGYEPPQILLLHASRLNAAHLEPLIAMLKRRGYTIVTLDQALRDPAYRRPDRYAGRAGITWLHRWAITEAKPRSLFRGEPAVPPFIEEAAR